MAKGEFKVIQELIRNAYNQLDPVDKFSYLYKKNMVDTLYGKKPDCFLALKRLEDGGRMGQELNPYLLPICNRAGFEDPDIIKYSLEKIQQLMDDESGQFDTNDLQKALSSLQHRHDVYSKEVPKPARTAGYKANTTRMFNNIKNHLQNK